MRGARLACSDGALLRLTRFPLRTEFQSEPSMVQIYQTYVGNSCSSRRIEDSFLEGNPESLIAEDNDRFTYPD